MGRVAILLACALGTTSGDKGAKGGDEVDFKDISIEEALRLLEVRQSGGQNMLSCCALD